MMSRCMRPCPLLFRRSILYGEELLPYLNVSFANPNLRVAQCEHPQKYQECNMHRKISTAVVAIALFAGTTTLSFGENAGGASNPSSQSSSGQAIGPQDSSGQTIGSASSTHNPAPSSSSPTGLNRKDGETGTVTSTHNPPSERTSLTTAASQKHETPPL